MSQVQIQQEKRQERMLEKASILVANKKVRKSICKESRNIWMISSYLTPKNTKKWYVVKWNEELDALMYACQAFEYSAASSCIRIRIFAADAYIFAGEKV